MAHKKVIKKVVSPKGETVIKAETKKKEKKTKKLKFDKPKLTPLGKMFPVKPLTNFHGNQFKELVQLSNTCAAAQKDVNEKEIMAFRLRQIVKQMNEGKLKPPFLQEILPKVWAQIPDVEAAKKIILDNAISLENAAQLGLGQVGHRYEEYVDAEIRFINTLKENVKDAKLKTVSHHRTDAKSDKEQDEIFDKGFDAFVKNEKEARAKIAEREANELLKPDKDKEKVKTLAEFAKEHSPEELQSEVEKSWEDKKKRSSKK